MKFPWKHPQKQRQQQQELSSKSLTLQIKKINIFLILVLIFTGAQIFFSFSSAITPDNVTIEDKEQQHPTTSSTEPPKDIITLLFSNSVTSMLLSTFIIGIVGVLINKLRNFKKKLDMIEILTKSQVKLKQQADLREKNFEERFIKSQNLVSTQISNLCSTLDTRSKELNKKLDSATDNLNKKLDDATDDLNKKLDTKTRELKENIEEVKDQATNALIDYLRNNPVGRKR